MFRVSNWIDKKIIFWCNEFIFWVVGKKFVGMWNDY